MCFTYYYIDTSLFDQFSSLFSITPYWFNQAQVVYLIWNAINDPLFGYLQVKMFFQKTVNYSVLQI